MGGSERKRGRLPGMGGSVEEEDSRRGSGDGEAEGDGAARLGDDAG